MDDARAVANKSTGPGCVQWANAHLVHMLNQFSKYIYIYSFPNSKNSEQKYIANWTMLYNPQHLCAILTVRSKK